MRKRTFFTETDSLHSPTSVAECSGFLKRSRTISNFGVITTGDVSSNYVPTSADGDYDNELDIQNHDMVFQESLSVANYILITNLVADYRRAVAAKHASKNIFFKAQQPTIDDLNELNTRLCERERSNPAAFISN